MATRLLCIIQSASTSRPIGNYMRNPRPIRIFLFFAQSELPEAYRTLYQSYAVENPTPAANKTFSKLMELLKEGPQAMADYFQEDDVDEFDGKFFAGCPLPNNSLGF